MDRTFVAHIARMQLEKAARAMSVSEDLLTVLRYPKRILKMAFPIRRDSGAVTVSIQ